MPILLTTKVIFPKSANSPEAQPNAAQVEPANPQNSVSNPFAGYQPQDSSSVGTANPVFNNPAVAPPPAQRPRPRDSAADGTSPHSPRPWRLKAEVKGSATSLPPSLPPIVLSLFLSLFLSLSFSLSFSLSLSPLRAVHMKMHIYIYIYIYIIYIYTCMYQIYELRLLVIGYMVEWSCLPTPGCLLLTSN